MLFKTCLIFKFYRESVTKRAEPSKQFQRIRLNIISVQDIYYMTVTMCAEHPKQIFKCLQAWF